MGKFLIKATSTGYKFDLIARNGRVIATSEVYLTLPSCKTGIASVRKNAPIAGLCDLTLSQIPKVKNPKFELYRDKAGDYRFRLKARNGEIIAVSEGYAARSGCLKGLESVRQNATKAVLSSPVQSGPQNRKEE